MAKIEVIPQTVKRKQALRVAAYARVSEAKEESILSLSAQVDYYTKLINANPKWTMAGIYVDEAVTGTKETRPNFMRMMTDCRAGKIDCVITKTVSRFARNTVTLLSACRELKELGIDVYFEAQYIHSNSGEGELMLSLMASLAQEEARSDSENMKWAVKKSFEQGKPWNTIIYGYKLLEGTFTVVPDEAEVVRRIFGYYLDGLGSCKIAQILNSERVPTLHNSAWRDNTIISMLTNRTYTGDLLLQKTYSENYISKRKMMNNGELPMYIVEEAHEPIVDRATFNAVQRELAQRSEKFKGKTNRRTDYTFSGKIVCDYCGDRFSRRTFRNKVTWICTTYKRKGKSVCPCSKQIPDEVLTSVTAEVLGNDCFDEAEFTAKIDHISACPDNRLVFHFKDGTSAERTWQERSRSESWTEEMKEQARLAALRRYT